MMNQKYEQISNQQQMVPLFRLVLRENEENKQDFH